MSGSGPWGSGVTASFDFVATVPFDPAGPIRIERIESALASPVSDEARVHVDGYLIVLAHHVADDVGRRALPPLPLPVFEIPGRMNVDGVDSPTGVTAGTALETRDDALGAVGDALEAAGDLEAR